MLYGALVSFLHRMSGGTGAVAMVDDKDGQKSGAPGRGRSLGDTLEGLPIYKYLEKKAALVAGVAVSDSDSDVSLYDANERAVEERTSLQTAFQRLSPGQQDLAAALYRSFGDVSGDDMVEIVVQKCGPLAPFVTAVDRAVGEKGWIAPKILSYLGSPVLEAVDALLRGGASLRSEGQPSKGRLAEWAARKVGLDVGSRKPRIAKMGRLLPKRKKEGAADAAAAPEGIAPVAAASASWLVDTGASDHVTNGELDEREEGSVRPIQTANGLVHVKEHGKAATPVGQQSGVRKIPGSPNLLSVGTLVSRGYSFAWHAGQRPCLHCPDGTSLVLDTVNRVPVMGSPAIQIGDIELTGEQLDAVFTEFLASAADDMFEDVVEDFAQRGGGGHRYRDGGGDSRHRHG